MDGRTNMLDQENLYAVVFSLSQHMTFVRSLSVLITGFYVTVWLINWEDFENNASQDD